MITMTLMCLTWMHLFSNTLILTRSSVSGGLDSETIHLTDIEVAAKQARCEPEEVKNKVARVIQPFRQRSLRNEIIFLDFKKIVLDYRNNDELLLCKSDDIYFVYNCKEDQLEDWFIKHHTSRSKIMSYQQGEIIGDISAWRPVDRGKYPVCERLTSDLRALSAMVRFYLG